MIPPYAADTRAKGWRFELDYEKIDQSDTWAIAAEIPMGQSALLMMWFVSWTQEPCGSLPNDENVIRAKCRIPVKAWPALRVVLMRGWWLADDGRLYHPTITTRVLEMVDYRARAAKRKAEYRDSHKSPEGVPRDSAGDGVGDTTGKNDTGTGTGTKEKEIPEANASGAANVIALDAAAAEAARKEAVFALGVPMLEAAGNSEKTARHFLGHLRKNNTDRLIVAALDRCAKERALDPRAFLMGCLKAGPGHVNRQEALEADGDRVVAEWLKGQG